MNIRPQRDIGSDNISVLLQRDSYNTWEEVNDPNRSMLSAWNSNKLQPGDVKYRDVNGGRQDR